MLDLFATHAQDCGYLWYFDPDIFIRCNWTFFADWQQNGIALCQEIVNNILPTDSPLRHKWMRIAADIGLNNPRPLNHYLSGGMVGVSSEHASFLHLWGRIIELARREGCDLGNFMSGNRESPFYGSDQDALNIAAMYTEHPLTTMGPEAMGFVAGGFTMYHAVGQKPWRGSLLLEGVGRRAAFRCRQVFPNAGFLSDSRYSPVAFVCQAHRVRYRGIHRAILPEALTERPGVKSGGRDCFSLQKRGSFK